MTQVWSRRDGKGTFFREGLCVTSQFGALFFFSVDQLGTEMLRASGLRPPTLRITGQERQNSMATLYRDYTTPIHELKAETV